MGANCRREERYLSHRTLTCVLPARRALSAAITMIVAIGAHTACSAPANADAAAAPGRFGASGRSLRVVVDSRPGGGHDLYARIMAPYLSRHLPGRPKVIVDNMPGGGGQIAAAHLRRRAAADGWTMGMLSMQPVVEQLARTSDVDVREMPVVGSPVADTALCAFTKSAAWNLEAWRRGRTPRIGMNARWSATAVYPHLLTAALDLPMKAVVGYPGTPAIKAGMASGEVDGVCMSRGSYLAGFAPRDAYDVLLLAGGRDPEWPQAMAAEDLVSSDRGRRLLSVLALVSRLSRYYVLPPGTPPDRVTAVRDAFARTMADPAFLSAAAAAQLPIAPQSPASIEADIRALLALPSDLQQELLGVVRLDTSR